MLLKDLTETVRATEAIIAPGSESSLWGGYCEAMRQTTGHLPYHDHPEDVVVTTDEAKWWIGAYAHLEEHPEATLDECREAAERFADQ